MFKFLKKSLSFVMILMLVTSLVSNVYALDFISSDNADTNEIVENIEALISLIKSKRPSTVKGTYVQNISVSASMGPGFKVQITN